MERKKIFRIVLRLIEEIIEIIKEELLFKRKDKGKNANRQGKTKRTD